MKISKEDRAKYVRPVLRPGPGGTVSLELFVLAQWVVSVAAEMNIESCKMGGAIELPFDPLVPVVTLTTFVNISKIEPISVRDEVRSRLGSPDKAPVQLLQEKK